MKRDIGYIALIILSMAFAILYGKHITEENQYLRMSFEKYTIANGKNMGVKNKDKKWAMYNQVAADYGLDPEWIWTGAVHENISEGFTHGAKKFPASELFGNPETWQPAAWALITNQEAWEFITKDKERFKEFCKQFGERYCGNDKTYWRSVYHIYLEEKDND